MKWRRVMSRLGRRIRRVSRSFSMAGIIIIVVYNMIAVFQRQGQDSLNRNDQPEWMNETDHDNDVCKIPIINPFDNESLELIYSEKPGLKPPPCLEQPRRFVSDLRSSLLRVNLTSFFWKGVNCCYTPFRFDTGVRNKLIFNNRCTEITTNDNNGTTVIPRHISHIRVTCTHKSVPNLVLYTDFFSFFRRWKSLENTLDLKIDPSEPDQLNIIYLGIDSVSLRNFQRFMPRTHKFLLNDLSAIEFTGLNKVGRGTTENLIPVLTGCPVTPNEEVIYPKNETKDCTPIWERYSTKGYRSIYTADYFWSHMFKKLRRNYKAGGFRKHNTTYDNFPLLGGLHSRAKDPLTTGGCFEHQFGADIIIERIIEVAAKYPVGTPYYHHIWSAVSSHEYMVTTKYLDAPFRKLLIILKDHDFLKNAVLIVNSDHGLISSKYSRTKDGLIEARQPLLYMVFPEWFKSKYSLAFQNLQQNADILITPFDLHQTLKDLSSMKTITKSALSHRSPSGSGVNDEFGISLFLPIPPRSCQMAHIPIGYCTCTPWDKSTTKIDPNMTLAVNTALDSMNRELLFRGKGKCIKLDLWRIIDVKRTVEEPNAWLVLYIVQFQTLPGQGIFSALLEAVSDNRVSDGVQFQVIGQIERQNMYGNQSACLGEELGWLRSACYCKNRKIKKKLNKTLN